MPLPAKESSHLRGRSRPARSTRAGCWPTARPQAPPAHTCQAATTLWNARHKGMGCVVTITPSAYVVPRQSACHILPRVDVPAPCLRHKVVCFPCYDTYCPRNTGHRAGALLEGDSGYETRKS